MAYEYQSLGVREFISDNTVKLPRFQRKATWTPRQNFNLCVSMFKGYPLGVVIYNTTKNRLGQTVSYLLDGRQRRNALKKCIENPVELYKAACKAMSIKIKMTPDEVTRTFWSNVEMWLNPTAEDRIEGTRETDPLEDDNEEILGEKESRVNDPLPDLDQDAGINSEMQKGNLRLLHDLILMIHGKQKKSLTPWEGRWLFSPYVQYLPYYKQKTKQFDPVKLKDFILELSSHLPAASEKITPELLAKAIDDMGYQFNEGGGEAGFINYAKMFLEQLCKDIRIVSSVNNDVYSIARLGVIRINNVTDLDSQNIFSLVNSGGTPLKAEELLSAKPYWNRPIAPSDLSADTKNKIQNLYSTLGIPGEDDGFEGTFVNWDLCATLLDRIDQQHLLFPILGTEGNKKDDQDLMNKIVWGFKIASATLAGGIGATYTELLEKSPDLLVEIDNLVHDINDLVAELMKHIFYQRLHQWGRSIMSLFNLGPTCDFIAVLRKKWTDLGCGAGVHRDEFVRASYVLFDRLVFEYTSGLWKGSSDSKLRNHLANYKERFTALPKEDWVNLVESVCGESNENYATKEAILYYFVTLQSKMPNPSGERVYDIDHIIPQSKIEAAPDGIVNKKLKNSLGNMALLPRGKNESKSAKFLKEVGDDLKMEISQYADIPVTDFSKYSNLTSLPELVAERKNLFLGILEKRSELFGS